MPVMFYFLIWVVRTCMCLLIFFIFCGKRASHCCGLSRCGAQAPDTQAQRPRLTGHVGSSRTGARTRVPCIGRQTLNYCATREAPPILIKTLRWLPIALEAQSKPLSMINTAPSPNPTAHTLLTCLLGLISRLFLLQLD